MFTVVRERFPGGFPDRTSKQGMVYRGAEPRMRVHNFVVLNSMEHGISTGVSVEERMQLFDERVKLLID